MDVQLYKTGDFGGPEFQVTLATGIPPEQGNVNIIVPDLPAGDKYFLMGESQVSHLGVVVLLISAVSYIVAHWGNDSPHFSIVQ